MCILRRILLLSLVLVITISGFSQLTVIDTIYLGPKAGNGWRPTAVGVNPKTNRIYTINEGNQNVSVIDGSTDSVTATVWFGVTGSQLGLPCGVAVDSVRNRIYVVGFGEDSVCVIDKDNVLPQRSGNIIMLESRTKKRRQEWEKRGSVLKRNLH